jgi:hypothetical protein
MSQAIIMRAREGIVIRNSKIYGIRYGPMSLCCLMMYHETSTEDESHKQRA